jgi:hypothetical protein
MRQIPLQTSICKFGAPNFIADLCQPDLERQIYKLFVQISRGMRQIPPQTSDCKFGAPNRRHIAINPGRAL